MDPNAALAQIRTLVNLYLTEEFEEAGGINGAVDLAELIMGLDAWIGSGGFLPTDWERAS